MARKKITSYGFLKKLLFIFPLLILSYFLTNGINLPFVGPNAWNFNTYSLIARNYNQFGLLNTGFAQIISVSSSFPKDPQYYMHHPPLVSVIESLLFKLFGEYFWVGRLTVILFSFASGILLFLIAKDLKGPWFAFISLFIYSLIPASTVFGRMIGQEPLVLFFALLTLYLILNYLKTGGRIYLIFTFISVILGTLSDWPMVYFVLLLNIYLFYKNRWKLGLSLFFISIFFALLFFANIYFLLNDFSNIKTALAVRSVGELLQLELWPFRWSSVIILRFMVYFNPIFVLFSFLYFYRRNGTKNIEEKIIFFSLFLFGLVHVILYPEGSFGHPYWIYYFIPFIVLCSSGVILNLLKNKKYIWVGIIFIFSFLYLFKIEDWKTKETKANIWRYSLAKQINTNLLPFESIIINNDSAIDPDIYTYQFSHPVYIEKFKKISNIKNIYNYYVYSCVGICDSSIMQNFADYQFIKFNSAEGQAFLIFLNKKVQEKSKKQDFSYKAETVKTPNLPYNENYIKKAYIFLRGFLKAPQI